MPKNFDDGGTAEELTRDHIFTGADHDDDLDEEITGDRGDDLDFIPEDEDKDEKPDDQEDEDQVDAGEDAGTVDDDGEDSGDSESDSEDDASEDDDDADEDEGGENDTGDDDDPVSPYVSKDRFNAVNERMKLAEQKLQERELAEAEAAKAEEVEAFDFDAKEREYMELVNDGEYDKAAAARKEIRAAERAEIQAEQNAQRESSAGQVAEQVAFTNKVAELAEEFDAFNPAHKDYDQVLVDEAVLRRDLFISRGMGMADALEKAAFEVAKLYDVESKYERMAQEEINRQEAEKPKPPAKKKTNVKKKVEQAAKQPTKMDEGSAGSEGEKAPSDMDEAEFDALPESTKARLRGDIV